MSLTKRAIMVLATLGLGAMTWSSGSLPGDPGTCGVTPAVAAGSAGCCHYNKGVCSCKDGTPTCCDGKVSASCRCGGITTRQINIDTQPLISVADFAFASMETTEPPSPRLTLFRLGADALRFWFRLDCNEECWNRLAVGGSLPLEVRWLFDPGSGPLLDGVPQSIMLPRNRPTVFVSRPPTQLRLGRWETEVRFDTERLCTRGDDRCWFRIQVQR